MSHKYFSHKDGMRVDIPPVEPPPPEVIAKARMIICGNSHDAEEAAMFLDMLGVPVK